MIMIGCAALNLAFAARQAAAFGSVSAGVLPVNAFELWYVANGLVINEAAHTYTSTQHVQITCTSHTQHRGSACKVRTLSYMHGTQRRLTPRGHGREMSTDPHAAAAQVLTRSNPVQRPPQRPGASPLHADASLCVLYIHNA